MENELAKTNALEQLTKDKIDQKMKLNAKMQLINRKI